MQALAVVEACDVICHIELGFRMVRVTALPDALHLQVQEEAFSDGVIPAISFAAHAADKAMLGQQRLVLLARILAAAIRMDDQSGRWTARFDRHTQGVANQGGRHARRHRPAYDSAREQVEYNSQVKPPGASPDIRDIRCVSQIRRRRVELSGKHVLRNWQSMLAISRVHELALLDWLQASLLHELAYLVTPTLKPLLASAVTRRRLP